MTPSRTLLGFLPLSLLASSGALAQSLCDPCVDPPNYDTLDRPGTESLRTVSPDYMLRTLTLLSTRSLAGQPSGDEDAELPSEDSPPVPDGSERSSPEEAATLQELLDSIRRGRAQEGPEEAEAEADEVTEESQP